MDKAGGFSPNVDKNNIWVEHPNGFSENIKVVLISPRIKDGSLINGKQTKAS